MRPRRRVETSPRLGFPRVSGDAPQISLDAWRDGMFSPRERGCARGSFISPFAPTVFPA